jgi:hypothetical protein
MLDAKPLARTIASGPRHAFRERQNFAGNCGSSKSSTISATQSQLKLIPRDTFTMIKKQRGLF